LQIVILYERNYVWLLNHRKLPKGDFKRLVGMGISFFFHCKTITLRRVKMVMARKYEHFEVRDLLRNAEGTASPITGKGGHSRGLHAMSPQVFDKASQLDRVTKRPDESNSRFKKRGGTKTTGAFMNVIQQSSAATQALNSTYGQNSLAVFDDLAHASVPVRIVLAVVGIKEADFIPGSLAPHSTTVTQGETSVTVVGSTSGVQLILDRAAGATSFQIQTCYPLSGATVSTNWKAENYTDKTELGSG
jgi:hypothetical protein